MGKKEPVRLVVIVEDRQLERFVRKTLDAYGLDKHKIIVPQDYPKRGDGSGKRYVEMKYQKEVVTYRRNARENRALLLASEADEQSVDDRVRVLDEQFAAIGKPSRGAGERIAYWVPKRQVETWGLRLTNPSVFEEKTLDGVEEEDCHNKAKNVDWRLVGREFRDRQIRTRTEEAQTSELPSLIRAYLETERLRL